MLFSKTNKSILSLTLATITIFSCSMACADYTEDTAITAEVKAKLLTEPDLPRDISVSTKDRIVRLEGNVDTTLQA